jgi:arylsulfatase A-like enzyme
MMSAIPKLELSRNTSIKKPPDKFVCKTPETDKFAKQGVMYTQFNACKVCAPARARIMTGKMNNRKDIWDAIAM